jgi:hypothetical protein
MDQHEEIKKVAYELYEKSGRIGGCEIENWLAAEKIVMARKAQNERGIKAAAPAANRMPKKTSVNAKLQKTKAKDAGPKGIEAGKAGAKKTAPKKTTKKAK